MRHDRLREEEVKRTLEKIASIENAVNAPYYDLHQQEKLTVNIRVDKSVPPAMFKPDPLNPGGWIANELTFRAMKKDIFALGSDLDQLKEPYTCQSCKSPLDRQFWNFCPYCAEKFEGQ